jgi:glycosyltransferase involved in cell wall biosynthesis
MKKVSLILEAMKRVQQSDSNVILTRVGGAVESGGYWKTGHDLKKQLEIKHFKNVPEGLMPCIYSAADVFLSPNVYDEGFNYPPLEAMACGVPIMTSNMKVFEKWGLTIPDSPKELSEMILSILNSRTLSRKLSMRSLRGSREFSLEREVKSTYEVYEEICRR